MNDDRAVVRRRTRQKDAVLRVVMSAREHPTAEQVYDEVRRVLPRISLGTVYRILGSLVLAGQLRVIETPHGPRRYDPTMGSHGHIVCEQCGTIRDVTSGMDRLDGDHVAAETGFDVRDCYVRWIGVCPTCLSDQSRRSPDTGEEQENGM